MNALTLLKVMLATRKEPQVIVLELRSVSEVLILMHFLLRSFFFFFSGLRSLFFDTTVIICMTLRSGITIKI